MKTRILPVALAASALLLLAAPAPAGGRGRPNPAWLETLELARSVRSSPQATVAELDRLSERMGGLSAEQRRLIAEAVELDAEEDWLLATAAEIEEAKRRFEQACSEITSEDQLGACQDMVDAVNGRVREYDARLAPFLSREPRYTADVRAWLTGLEEMRGWMRTILSRRTLGPEERAALEAQRASLRAEIDGLQEALRRLEQGRLASEADRADWERAVAEARERAVARLKDYLADQAIEAAQALFEKCSERLTRDVRAKIDERINVAGGSAPDKAERVKALDAEIASLVRSRADVDSAGPALGRAVAALKHGFAALESDAPVDREKALEEMRDVVGDVVADPAVQRALRISEAPATVFTYLKLIADSSFDITTELLALVRLGSANEASERYLEDVRRLDEQMKRRVARLQELNRLLDAP